MIGLLLKKNNTFSTIFYRLFKLSIRFHTKLNILSLNTTATYQTHPYFVDMQPIQNRHTIPTHTSQTLKHREHSYSTTSAHDPRGSATLFRSRPIWEVPIDSEPNENTKKTQSK